MVGQDYHTKHFPRIPRPEPAYNLKKEGIIAAILVVILFIVMGLAGREDYKAQLDADSFRLAAERQHELNKKAQIEEMERRAHGN